MKKLFIAVLLSLGPSALALPLGTYTCEVVVNDADDTAIVYLGLNEDRFSFSLMGEEVSAPYAKEWSDIEAKHFTGRYKTVHTNKSFFWIVDELAYGNDEAFKQTLTLLLNSKFDFVNDEVIYWISFGSISEDTSFREYRGGCQPPQ